jgi:hypothetical protein
MAGIGQIGRQNPIRGQQVSHVHRKKIQAFLHVPLHILQVARRLSDLVRENLERPRSGSRGDRLGNVGPAGLDERYLGIVDRAGKGTTVVRSLDGARPGRGVQRSAAERRGGGRELARAGSLPKQSFARGGAAITFVDAAPGTRHRQVCASQLAGEAEMGLDLESDLGPCRFGKISAPMGSRCMRRYLPKSKFRLDSHLPLCCVASLIWRDLFSSVFNQQRFNFSKANLNHSSGGMSVSWESKYS